jgi:hypothetical protein
VWVEDLAIIASSEFFGRVCCSLVLRFGLVVTGTERRGFGTCAQCGITRVSSAMVAARACGEEF